MVFHLSDSYTCQLQRGAQLPASPRISRVAGHLNQLLDGDELVPLLLEIVDDAGKRLDVLRTVAAAVVHQHDRPVMRARHHGIMNRLGSGTLPIERIDIPQHVHVDQVGRLLPLLLAERPVWRP